MMWLLLAPYRFVQELFYVIVIIGILAVIAIGAYRPCQTKAQVISITSIFNAARINMQTYYAQNGQWPEDIGPQIENIFKNTHNPITAQQDIDVKDGAVSFTFTDADPSLLGKTLTLRPVIWGNDLFGPVHWVCGNKQGDPGWKIHGVDQTSIDKRFIPGSFQ